MEDESKQLEFWSKLDSTTVVETTAGSASEPWRAPSRQAVAKAFGDAEAQRKGRESAGALDLGKSGAAWAHAGAARYKGPARIVAAKHGNAFVVTRRRKD